MFFWSNLAERRNKTFKKITKINDFIPVKNTILLRTHSRTDNSTLPHFIVTNLIQYDIKGIIKL